MRNVGIEVVDAAHTYFAKHLGNVFFGMRYEFVAHLFFWGLSAAVRFQWEETHFGPLQFFEVLALNQDKSRLIENHPD